MSVKIVDGGIGCMRDDCVTQHTTSMTTLVYYPQIFDKSDTNVNPDGNEIVTDVRCTSCGKSWKESWKNGTKISFE